MLFGGMMDGSTSFLLPKECGFPITFELVVYISLIGKWDSLHLGGKYLSV